MTPSASLRNPRRTTVRLAALAGIALLGAIGFDVYRRAHAMRPVTVAAATILAATPGERINAMVRIENSTAADVYTAVLLESSGGADYTETPTHMRIVLDAATAFIMGGAADIKPGAVVQVSGETDATHTLHARKVVILSGYVRVDPRRT
jgi:hypothetical protein